MVDDRRQYAARFPTQQVAYIGKETRRGATFDLPLNLRQSINCKARVGIIQQEPSGRI